MAAAAGAHACPEVGLNGVAFGIVKMAFLVSFGVPVIIRHIYLAITGIRNRTFAHSGFNIAAVTEAQITDFFDIGCIVIPGVGQGYGFGGIGQSTFVLWDRKVVGIGFV